MAKVEMSLEEYNALKDELDFLRRVVKEITTPIAESWRLEHYRKLHMGHSISTKISKEVKEYLESQMTGRIPAEYDTPEFKFTFSFPNVDVLRAEFLDSDDDKEQPSENQ